MLTQEHIKECLSRAFIYAIGGRAGIDVSLGEGHDYGVDGTLRQIREINGRRVKSGIALDIQLKATINWSNDNNEIVYDLNSKNYNDLIHRTEGVDLVLVLLCLPRCEHLWLASDGVQMLLRHCCYWYRPVGEPVENTATKRIRIPISNRITVANITTLFAAARARETGQ